MREEFYAEILENKPGGTSKMYIYLGDINAENSCKGKFYKKFTIKTRRVSYRICDKKQGGSLEGTYSLGED